MATARETVTWALRKAAIIDPSGEPAADEMTSGLNSFNEMLSSWAIDGIDFGLGTLAADDVIDVEPSYLRGIRYNLAADIADEYGAQLSPMAIAIADREERKIRASLFTIAELTVDGALLRGSTGLL